MKYGIVVYEEKREQEREQEKEQFITNVGNYVQWLAIEELYSYMGLKEDDIVRLKSEELYDYKGEKLILPINYMMCDADICVYTTKDHRFIFSEDIIPVFLGISIKKGYWEWTDERIAYFKKYEPIGCRDYLTWKTITDLGIRAYLAGCLTWTFPLDKKRKEGKTVYFVEAPKAVEEYVPSELKKDCKFISQEIKITEEQFYDREYGWKATRDLLEEYKQNAKLVVTSRLHCASPCMAMGIPVILVKEYFGYPFDLLGKFVPLYSYKNFDQIDWYPERVDLEGYKKIALECARKRLLCEDADKEIENLHKEFISLYEGGYQEEEMDLGFLFQKLAKLYRGDEKFRYAIWGISNNAEKIFEHISTHYPQAELVKVIDSFRKQEFHDIMSEVPDVLGAQDDFLVIVSTLNCSAAAKPFFEKLGKQEDGYISVTDGIMYNL